MSAARWRREIEAIVRQEWPALADGPRWIEAQVDQESRGNPDARSHVGAVGLLQLMPATAAELGLIVREGADERLIPERNLWAGVRYLRIQFEHFPEIPDDRDRLYWSFAAYNGGRGYCNAALRLAAPALREMGLPLDWELACGALKDPGCVVHGRRPDAGQMLEYVRRIHFNFEALAVVP